LAVDVHNSSTADENLSLSALTDAPYGDITSLHGSVLGTTCGVATGVVGLGTLSGSTGGGILPATIATGKDYNCKFDAQICGDLTQITLPNNAGTCLGLTDSDSVTPTIAGDEGETVSHTDNTLNEIVCFTHIP